MTKEDLIESIKAEIPTRKTVERGMNYFAMPAILKTVVVKSPEESIIELILRIISEHYAASRAGMKGKQRNADLVLARSMFFYMARRHTHMSLVRCGDVLDRDHSTALYSINKINNEVNYDKHLKREMIFLDDKISRAMSENGLQTK